MQRLLSNNLWQHLKSLARKSKRKAAAVSYVTSDRIIGFGDGDTLIVDASDDAIKSARTSADVLSRARKRGAHLFSFADLHAKVMVLDRVAVIGSANLSGASVSSLVEAALVTDDPATVAQASVMIDQLTAQAEEIDAAFIRRIKALPVKRQRSRVKRRGKRPLLRLSGGQTWLIGVTELDDNAFPDEEERAEAGRAIAERRLSTKRSDVNWIRWSRKGSFAKDAAEGDTVIQIWGPRHGKRARTYRHSPILFRQREPTCVRFYVEEYADADDVSLSMSEFRQLARKVGLPGKVGPHSCRKIAPSIAAALNVLWTM